MIASLSRKKPETSVEKIAETVESKTALDDPIIQQITDICNQISTGDLEARINGIPGNHQLKNLAEAINNTLDLIDAYTRESATAIQYCSEDKFYRPLLTQGLLGAFRKSAATINKGGLRMKESHGKFTEISELVEENTSSINTIAAACEELSVTNSEISKNASISVTNTHQVAEDVRGVNNSLHKMTEAIKEIDRTVVMIENIADQTSLLALNAMIEASRAGARGSRFEVVANEVKELAKNTSTATQQIKDKVERIRLIAFGTEDSFEKIHDKIKGTEDSGNLINHSLQNQIAATQEVTHNINEVAKTMEVVTEKIREMRG